MSCCAFIMCIVLDLVHGEYLVNICQIAFRASIQCRVRVQMNCYACDPLPVAPAHLVPVQLLILLAWYLFIPSGKNTVTFPWETTLPSTQVMWFGEAALFCSSSVGRCPCPGESKHSIPATPAPVTGCGEGCVSDPLQAKCDATLRSLLEVLGNNFNFWDG